jgi:hypothetical protein
MPSKKMMRVMRQAAPLAQNRIVGTTAATSATGERMTADTPPWRSVALPIEHGGWSFLIEPLILGLVVAPSAAGAGLAASATAVFLARHPLKLIALDRRKGIRYPRTGLAERFCAIYMAVAAFAFATALARSDASILLPLAVAAPFALSALGLDLQGRGREAWPEIAGAIGLGSSATAIILAGGGSAGTAWAAWALGAGRALTAIFYVRARVRVDRDPTQANRPTLAWPVLAIHALVLTLALGAQAMGLISPIAVAAFILLLLRAAFGLAPGRKPIRPRTLGIQEVLIGLTCLALFALGLPSAHRP